MNWFRRILHSRELKYLAEQRREKAESIMKKIDKIWLHELDEGHPFRTHRHDKKQVSK